jgi:ribosomal protein L37E
MAGARLVRHLWGVRQFALLSGHESQSRGSRVNFCSRCGSGSYDARSAFCTRCGASLNSSPAPLRYYNAPPAPRTGWKSLPFVVRLTVYALCVPVLLGVLMWLSVLATILSLFQPPTHP